MKGAGPRRERETVIVYNEEEDSAWIWTASERDYKRLLKRGFEPREDRERSATFFIPKKCVPLRRRRKQLSETDRQALRDRAFKLRSHDISGVLNA
jgi:hypothetical protein